MKIACYALAHNEELIMPHFIEHYKKFCHKIVVYDNMSTDNTKQIALDNGCEVISWEAKDGGFNDLTHLEIKSNCYKKDKETFDWAITVDSDELISHKDGTDGLIKYLEYCKSKNIKLPKVKGFNMFSWDYEFDNPLDSIVDCIPSDSYGKSVVFNTSLDMSWSPGCHSCFIPNDSDKTELVLKHYKFINLNYVINRSKYFFNRLSKINIENNYGIQYSWNYDQWYDYFKKLDKEKIKYGTYRTI